MQRASAGYLAGGSSIGGLGDGSLLIMVQGKATEGVRVAPL